MLRAHSDGELTDRERRVLAAGEHVRVVAIPGQVSSVVDAATR
jgi:hypothetical protein